MKSFDLLAGLFPDKNNTPETVKEPEQKEVPTTKRTFKISNEFWNDFVDLAAAKKMTQAELINTLIAESVNRDADLIAQYREFFGGHKEK